eukprot:CAMPEP_0176383392 /NCGR_PEP_ID=MMETSP0126-20121128/33475_1 /TAXON_ID=141414 ORGANISM="Strombidinopsis acuminatum, Strain SPMC142" /NCGR_SAMPLE_ID=MMETSP0126 /ASSEMBLY_ACC=CAM_ASM_000229 /LENGTH=114 /DNA_ID=CAMNT_0017748449 /DNA_START=168 /DNA_END=512 /DNA_ORIENTATION=-
MRFLLNMDDISGTNAERRINEVLAKSKSSTISYKLKESTLRFNANRKRYNASQKQRIRDYMSKVLYYFGYIKHPENTTEEMTAFYEFDKHDPEMLKRHAKFREDNESTIKFLAN